MFKKVLPRPIYSISNLMKAEKSKKKNYPCGLGIQANSLTLSLSSFSSPPQSPISSSISGILIREVPKAHVRGEE